MSAQPAFAHVDVRPTLIEEGPLAEIRVELPPLVGGRAPAGLEVEGPGIEVLSVRQQESPPPDTVWLVRLRANGRTGEVPLVLRALYGGGRSVDVDAALTVVPGPDDAGFPWLPVAIGSLLAVAFAAAGLVVARRKA